MAKPGPEQLKFGVRNGRTNKAKFSLPSRPKEVVESEKILWIPKMITRTQVTHSFFEEVGSPDIFLGAMHLGRAVHKMAAVSRIIYGEREWYCLDPKENPDKSIPKILPNSYPTGTDYFNIVKLLEDCRPSFTTAKKGHRPFEKEEIKEKLYLIWDHIAKDFDLGELEPQSLVELVNGVLLPSGRTALKDNVTQIARTIIEKKFDTLVSSDQDYHAILEPAFLIKMVVDGNQAYLYHRPDSIEELKTYQETTIDRERKGQIVSRIIVGDFKNSGRELIEDRDSPLGKSIRLEHVLNEFVASKFDWNLLHRKVRPLGWSRKPLRAFVIDGNTPDAYPPDQIETRFICLREDGEEMIVKMPELTKEDRKLAAADIRNHLRSAS